MHIHSCDFLTTPFSISIQFGLRLILFHVPPVLPSICNAFEDPRSSFLFPICRPCSCFLAFIFVLLSCFCQELCIVEELLIDRALEGKLSGECPNLLCKFTALSASFILHIFSQTHVLFMAKSKS